MSIEHADNLAEALRYLIISYVDAGVISKLEMENVLEDTLQYIHRRGLEPEYLQDLDTSWKYQAV
jgi:hypothetical protein